MSTPLPKATSGLGLRRDLLASLAGVPAQAGPDFLEVAPENWIRIGGRLRRQFDALAEHFPITTHGLSLSLGSPDPLDWQLLTDIRDFLRRYQVPLYSEHLSYCSVDGHLYDLLPMPFSDEAALHVAKRIRQVQDFLGQRIAVENISYYASPFTALTEAEFINAVLAEADCDLLLDVNNVYVNSINHGYDARDFIAAMPTHSITYMHVAGHFDEADDLKIDTHGSDVIDPVWQLLEFSYCCHGVHPTLLERDFNFPPLPSLLAEVNRIRFTQQQVNAASTRALP